MNKCSTWLIVASLSIAISFLFMVALILHLLGRVNLLQAQVSEIHETLENIDIVEIKYVE